MTSKIGKPRAKRTEKKEAKPNKGSKPSKKAAAAGKGKTPVDSDAPKQPKPQTAEVRIRRNISRVLRVKMLVGDLERSHRAQEEIVVALDEEQAKLENLAKELKAADERLKKIRAEIRECEDNRDQLHNQMAEHVRARQSGMMLSNVVVDEWVSNRGEIIHRKIGTMSEVGERRTATGEELEMANQARKDSGSPATDANAAKPGEAKPGDSKPESGPLFPAAGATDKPKKGRKGKAANAEPPVPPPTPGAQDEVRGHFLDRLAERSDQLAASSPNASGKPDSQDGKVHKLFPDRGDLPANDDSQ